jgi:hypothetical protein
MRFVFNNVSYDDLMDRYFFSNYEELSKNPEGSNFYLTHNFIFLYFNFIFFQ